MNATHISAIVIGIGLCTVSASTLAQTAGKNESTSPTTAPTTTGNAGQVSDQSWTSATVPGTDSTATPPAPAVPAPAQTAANPTTNVTAPSAPPTQAPNSDALEMTTSDEPVTLFGHKHVKYGGYGMLGVRYARIAGDDGTLVGGEGAFLLDHRLAIGLAGYGWANDKQLPRETQGFTHPHMHFGYGGLLLRYHVFVPQTPISLSVATLVGGGAVGVTQWWDDDVRRENADMFFIFEPQLGAYVHVTRWMRVGVDAGYRFVSGIGSFGLNESDFRGASVGASVGFGWF